MRIHIAVCVLLNSVARVKIVCLTLEHVGTFVRTVVGRSKTVNWLRSRNRQQDRCRITVYNTFYVPSAYYGFSLYLIFVEATILFVLFNVCVFFKTIAYIQCHLHGFFKIFPLVPILTFSIL